MSFIKTDDNVKLFYESIGKGEPIIFVHEFAGDYRSWVPQINYLSIYYPVSYTHLTLPTIDMV